MAHYKCFIIIIIIIIIIIRVIIIIIIIIIIIFIIINNIKGSMGCITPWKWTFWTRKEDFLTPTPSPSYKNTIFGPCCNQK